MKHKERNYNNSRKEKRKKIPKMNNRNEGKPKKYRIMPFFHYSEHDLESESLPKQKTFKLCKREGHCARINETTQIKNIDREEETKKRNG